MFTLSRYLSIEESAFLLDCSPEAITKSCTTASALVMTNMPGTATAHCAGA